jgi:PKHD-type hydroxylase
MLLQIPDVLTSTQVKEFRKMLDEANWVDGKVTAGNQARLVKNNSQLPEGSKEAKILGDQILMALEKNLTFISAALPLKVLPPYFNSYSGGQDYGTHVDNAIRNVAGTPFRIRADISATLFLSNPSDYDGGELVIEDTYGTHKIKLPAGHMILYPSSSLHFVKPVTRGARVSSFFWIESMVRQDEQRTLLFDLDNSIRALGEELQPSHKSVVHLTGIYHNLMRSWCNT